MVGRCNNATSMVQIWSVDHLRAFNKNIIKPQKQHELIQNTMQKPYKKQTKKTGFPKL